MKIQNYHEAIETLYSNLENYLQEHGIDTSTNFKCISSLHNDDHPSCSLVPPDKKVFHCFSCGISGGIFHAAHLLEGKAFTGPGFVDTLTYLANKYSVELEVEPLTEEELYELDTYKAYRLASEIITNNPNPPILFLEEIKRRGWDSSVWKSFNTGSVSDFKTFRDHLKSAGFAASFLDDIDLGRKEIFNSDRLIFTIKDEFGRPVGFASRNLSFDGDKKNGAKYINQRSTGVKCNIYKKSERLFGFDKALEGFHNKKAGTRSIYVFEGYADVITAFQHGIFNVCAIGGTALTAEQVYLLKKHNVEEVILCLDSDIPGQNKTESLLDSILAGHKDLKISIVVPNEGLDPDEFIREYGIKKFSKLKKWSAFEWRLNRFAENSEPEDICKKMLPLIVNEPSYIVQEQQALVLAKTTGITLEAIKQELRRYQNVKEFEKQKDRDLILESLSNKIRRNPINAELALSEAQLELSKLAIKYNEDSLTGDSCLVDIDFHKLAQEAKDGRFPGFILGEDLKFLQEALDGDWKKDCWFVLGGKPNAGKSSFLCKLATAIASHPEENDATVIFLSIDDTLKDIIPKVISVINGEMNITLNQIMDPVYHSKYTDKEFLLSNREKAYNRLKELVKNERLILKDANNGNSLAYSENLIRHYRDKYPNRNIVFMLDNFHKLRDLSDKIGGDERVRVKELSSIVKDLAIRYHATIISTIEYKKLEQGKKATNTDIMESGKIEYDANIIAHLHNELDNLQDKAKLKHYTDGSEIPLPIIELTIGKNKISEYKNRSLYFNFYPSFSEFKGVSEKSLANILELKNNNSGKNIQDILGAMSFIDD